MRVFFELIQFHKLVKFFNGLWVEENIEAGGTISDGNGEVKPYKVYVALLAQSASNAPVATVLENTLGALPVWSRNDVGDYQLTLEDTFTTNKTVIFCSQGGFNENGDVVIFTQTGFGGDALILNTVNASGAFADSLLYQTAIEVRVYN